MVMSCSTYTIVISDGRGSALQSETVHAIVLFSFFAHQRRAQAIVVDESVHLRERRMPIAACAQNPVKCFLRKIRNARIFFARAPREIAINSVRTEFATLAKFFGYVINHYLRARRLEAHPAY